MYYVCLYVMLGGRLLVYLMTVRYLLDQSHHLPINTGTKLVWYDVSRVFINNSVV